MNYVASLTSTWLSGLEIDRCGMAKHNVINGSQITSRIYDYLRPMGSFYLVTKPGLYDVLENRLFLSNTSICKVGLYWSKGQLI